MTDPLGLGPSAQDRLRQARYRELLDAIRNDPTMRPQWLTSVADTADPMETHLLLVTEVNRLQNLVELLESVVRADRHMGTLLAVLEQDDDSPPEIDKP